MEKQDVLQTDYRQKKRQFEEEDDDILFQRDQGIRDLEEISDMAHHYLKDYVPDQEYILQAVSQIDRLKDEVYEAAQHDRRRVEREIEELDSTYYHDLQKLSDQDVAKKESGF